MVCTAVESECCHAAAAVGALSASAAEHDAVAAARAELAAQVEALREQLGHAQVGGGEFEGLGLGFRV
jgi:hypothetical protein